MRNSHTQTILKSQVVSLLASMLGWEIECLKPALLVQKPLPGVSLHTVLPFSSSPYPIERNSVAWVWKRLSATTDFKNR